MYSIIVLPRAAKDLDRIPDNIMLRFEKILLILQDNPRAIGVIKLTGEEGYRIRIGDYRVLFEIDDEAKLVNVYRIRHRREVYR